MKFLVLILAPAFLLIMAPETRAHNLVTVNGERQDHQHVYRRQQYGKPLQQGHVFKSSKGRGVVLWGSGSRSDYGKLNGRRNGPIVDDRQSKPVVKKKFGSEVKGYGKPLRDYGSR